MLKKRCKNVQDVLNALPPKQLKSITSFLSGVCQKASKVGIDIYRASFVVKKTSKGYVLVVTGPKLSPKLRKEDYVDFDRCEAYTDLDKW